MSGPIWVVVKCKGLCITCQWLSEITHYGRGTKQPSRQNTLASWRKPASVFGHSYLVTMDSWPKYSWWQHWRLFMSLIAQGLTRQHWFTYCWNKDQFWVTVWKHLFNHILSGKLILRTFHSERGSYSSRLESTHILDKHMLFFLLEHQPASREPELGHSWSC